jgi:hypothetical protein
MTAAKENNKTFVPPLKISSKNIQSYSFITLSYLSKIISIVTAIIISKATSTVKEAATTGRLRVECYIINFKPGAY